MEKLAAYLFASGLLTVALMLVSYIVELVVARKRQGAASAGTFVAAGADGGEIDLGSDGTEAVGAVARYGTMLGWLGVVVLGLALAIRTSIAGRGPFSNMYDYSISFAFGILLIYLIIEWRYGIRTLGLFVQPVALGLLFYAASLPNEIAPLVPALQNNLLLTLHVSVAILAYSCFTVSFAAATLYLLQDRLNLRILPRLDLMDEIGFLSAALGFPFMTLVLVLGAYWANTAWGRYWGWDPKETASLVTWLIYAGYLHTRALRNWRGRRAAYMLLVGFVAVMLTYYGNLFFSGLHAYG